MTTSTCLPTSVTRARLVRLVAAAALAFAVSLPAAPAFAAEEPAETGDEAVEVAPEGAGAEEGSGRIQLAERPRDRFGLLLLGFLGAVTVLGAVTATRQLGGKRPQATGEFRWR
ncbi:hypothetical protein [Nitriliruptor alkaliphilus]|uniref:hypothetical protein n=1 Tax=Nitriliruptor alkaliphilus TaxID=427918 RepID=UPI0006989413|nr:hypothetical protein [Nitriliruptor alkaliphilus]